MVRALQPQGSDSVALSPPAWTTWGWGWCPPSSSQRDLASLGQTQTPLGVSSGVPGVPVLLSLPPIKH